MMLWRMTPMPDPILLDAHGAVIAAKGSRTGLPVRFYTLPRVPITTASFARIREVYETAADGKKKLIGAERVDLTAPAYTFYCESAALPAGDCRSAENYSAGDGSARNPWRNLCYALDQISCMQRSVCCAIRIRLVLTGEVNYRVTGRGCGEPDMLLIDASGCSFEVTEDLLYLENLTLTGADIACIISLDSDSGAVRVPTFVSGFSAVLTDCRFRIAVTEDIESTDDSYAVAEELVVLTFGTAIGCTLSATVTCNYRTVLMNLLSAPTVYGCTATAAITMPGTGWQIMADHLIRANRHYSNTAEISVRIDAAEATGESDVSICGLYGGDLYGCAAQIDVETEECASVGVTGIYGAFARDCSAVVTATANCNGTDENNALSSASAVAIAARSCENCTGTASAFAAGIADCSAYSYGGFIARAIAFDCYGSNGSFDNCTGSATASAENQRRSAGDIADERGGEPWEYVFAVRYHACNFDTTLCENVTLTGCNPGGTCGEVLNGTKDCAAYENDYWNPCADPCYYEYCLETEKPEDRLCRMEGKFYILRELKYDSVTPPWFDPVTNEQLYDSVTAELQIEPVGDITATASTVSEIDLNGSGLQFEFEVDFVATYAENTPYYDKPSIRYTIAINRDGLYVQPSSGEYTPDGYVTCE